MAGTFQYSLVRAIPDPRRGEWVNIGVVVYLENRIDVRIAKNLNKIRALNGRAQIGKLESIPDNWSAYCAGISDSESRQRLLAGFPGVYASPLGIFVADEKSYELQIQRIFDDLVNPKQPQPIKHEKRSSLSSVMTTQFRSMQLLAEDQKDFYKHKIVKQFAIDESASLYADFAMKNGALRIIETIDFLGTPETVRNEKRKQAAMKAITLDVAQRRFRNSQDIDPVILYRADEDSIDIAQSSLFMLADYGRLIDAGNSDEISRYLDELSRACLSN